MSAVASQDLARALHAISTGPGFNMEAEMVKSFKKQGVGWIGLGLFLNELKGKEGEKEAED